MHWLCRAAAFWLMELNEEALQGAAKSTYHHDFHLFSHDMIYTACMSAKASPMRPVFPGFLHLKPSYWLETIQDFCWSLLYGWMCYVASWKPLPAYQIQPSWKHCRVLEKESKQRLNGPPTLMSINTWKNEENKIKAGIVSLSNWEDISLHIPAVYPAQEL